MKTKHMTFKVGDRVRLTKREIKACKMFDIGHADGRAGKVTCTYPGRDMVRVRFPGNQRDNLWRASGFEPA